MAEFVAGSGIEPQVSRGRGRVAGALVHFYGGLTLVSDPPTVVAYAGRELFAVITLTIADGAVAKLHATVDPFAK